MTTILVAGPAACIPCGEGHPPELEDVALWDCFFCNARGEYVRDLNGGDAPCKAADGLFYLTPDATTYVCGSRKDRTTVVIAPLSTLPVQTVNDGEPTAAEIYVGNPAGVKVREFTEDDWTGEEAGQAPEGHTLCLVNPK